MKIFQEIANQSSLLEFSCSLIAKKIPVVNKAALFFKYVGIASRVADSFGLEETKNPQNLPENVIDFKAKKDQFKR